MLKQLDVYLNIFVFSLGLCVHLFHDFLSDDCKITLATAIVNQEYSYNTTAQALSQSL